MHSISLSLDQRHTLIVQKLHAAYTYRQDTHKGSGLQDGYTKEGSSTGAVLLALFACRVTAFQRMRVAPTEPFSLETLGPPLDVSFEGSTRALLCPGLGAPRPRGCSH